MPVRPQPRPRGDGRDRAQLLGPVLHELPSLDADRRPDQQLLLGFAERRHELVDQDRPRGRHARGSSTSSALDPRRQRPSGCGTSRSSCPTTGTDDGDFTLVHGGHGAEQRHPASTCSSTTRGPAKYVMLRFLNNRGSGCCVSALQLKAYTGQEDGLHRPLREPLAAAPTPTPGTSATAPRAPTPSPTHTFPGPGTYAVTLTATNVNGSSTYHARADRADAGDLLHPGGTGGAVADRLPSTPPRPSSDSSPGRGTSATARPASSRTRSRRIRPAGTYTVTHDGHRLRGQRAGGDRRRSPWPRRPSARMFHPRGGLNVASLENGASVIAFSSQFDAQHVQRPASSSTSAPPPPGPRARATRRSGSSSRWPEARPTRSTASCCSGARTALRPAPARLRDRGVDHGHRGLRTSRPSCKATLPANQTVFQVLTLPRPVLARYVLYRALNNRGSTVVTTACPARRVRPGEHADGHLRQPDRGRRRPASPTPGLSATAASAPRPSPTHTFPGPGLLRRDPHRHRRRRRYVELHAPAADPERSRGLRSRTSPVEPERDAGRNVQRHDALARRTARSRSGAGRGATAPRRRSRPPSARPTPSPTTAPTASPSR